MTATSKGKQPNPCPYKCGVPECQGPEKLREFSSWEDLTAHCGENTIVRWVNKLAVAEERSRFSHRQYNEKKKALVKAAMEQLTPSELAEIKRQAGFKAEEGM